MIRSANLSRPIVDALYEEALVLADEVRAMFAQGARKGARADAALASGPESEPGDAAQRNRIVNARLALSSEGLRTTTRIMHVLAWLLNQRAYYAGELTQRQALANGTLPPDRGADEAMLALLDADMRALVEETERLHRRIARLDASWREGLEQTSPVLSLQDRLEQSLRWL